MGGLSKYLSLAGWQAGRQRKRDNVLSPLNGYNKLEYILKISQPLMCVSCWFYFIIINMPWPLSQSQFIHLVFSCINQSNTHITTRNCQERKKVRVHTFLLLLLLYLDYKSYKLSINKQTIDFVLSSYYWGAVQSSIIYSRSHFHTINELQKKMK